MTKHCYQCDAQVNWLAPDSRCYRCTRMTAEEITGEHISDEDYPQLPCPGLEADWNGVCDHCGVHADRHTAANDPVFKTLIFVVENDSQGEI